MQLDTVEGSHPFTHATRYLLLAPRRPGPGPLPLLVALHGQGMTAEGFLDILRPLAPRRRLLLVPEGPFPFEVRAKGERRRGCAWYLYTGDQEAFRAQLVRVEEHLHGVIGEVAERHPVDPRRTVLLGFSQGGYLAGFVALRARQRFRGLVIAAARLKHEFLGAPLGRPGLPATLFLHGRNDPATPWERTAEGMRLLERSGAEVESFLHDDGHRLTPASVAHLDDWWKRKGFDGKRLPRNA